jgi:hypothetical protein
VVGSSDTRCGDGDELVAAAGCGVAVGEAGYTRQEPGSPVLFEVEECE